MKERMNFRRKIPVLTKHIFLITICTVLFYPIFIVIVNSFKSNKEIFKNTFGLPKEVIFKNYIDAFLVGNMGRAALNSTIVTLTSVVLIIVFSSFVSYALSRSNMKGKNVIYVLFVVMQAIPAHVGLLQLYKTIDSYGMSNQYSGLIAAYVALGLPFSVFVMKRFFEGIPKEIQESAVIDGCNNYSMFFRIIVPLSKTIITTVFIVNTVITWNDMLYPMVFISSKSLKPLPTALLAFKGEFISQYNMMFAGAVISSIPLIIIFILLQKQFVEGMTAGAVKG